MKVSTKQQRIAELAKRSPEVSFTSLNHYLDLEWLEAAYRRLRFNRHLYTGEDRAPAAAETQDVPAAEQP